MKLFVSMNLATRDRNLIPAVSRAYGCHVSPDLKTVTLFIHGAHNQMLLDNIQANRVIAAVFSRPSSHQTIQLKGIDARRAEVTSADHAVISDYRQSFIEELQSLGYPHTFTEVMLLPLDKLDTAISFTPIEAFTQTPGPQAGKKLSP